MLIKEVLTDKSPRVTEIPWVSFDTAAVIYSAHGMGIPSCGYGVCVCNRCVWQKPTRSIPVLNPSSLSLICFMSCLFCSVPYINLLQRAITGTHKSFLLVVVVVVKASLYLNVDSKWRFACAHMTMPLPSAHGSPSLSHSRIINPSTVLVFCGGACTYPSMLQAGLAHLNCGWWEKRSHTSEVEICL